MTRRLSGDSDNAAVLQWTKVLNTCFAQRLRPEEVEDALQECLKAAPIAGSELATLLLTCGGQSDFDCDPLLSIYLAHWLKSDLLQPADVLEALLQVSPYYTPTDGSQSDPPIPGISPAAQDVAFSLLPALYNSGDHPRNSTESARTFRALLSWLQAYNAFETIRQIDAGGAYNPDSNVVAAYENLGTFVAVMLSSTVVKKHLVSSIPKGAKSKIVSVITHFASTLAQWSQSTISQTLQFATKVPPFVSQSSNGMPEFTATEISAEVMDAPRSISRSGLYVYLNAALCGRPRISDGRLLSFLQVRYANDPQNMIGDLVIAAFDALANALQRQESIHLILCHRSFIANKVPLVIQALSARQLCPPAMTENYIQLAIGRIETHPFPPLSSDSAAINESIRDARQDFIRVCHSHSLISENTAAAALGQDIDKPASTTRYHKHNLVQQLLSNPLKAEELVGELDRMSGDVGNISAALVETLRQAALTKETMTIKTICIALCRNLRMVDIVLQHAPMNEILNPLGTYLNEWTQDEDQSELQPAYEDFAAILLLAVAILHRYDVQVSELDEFDEDSFIIKLQTQRARSTHSSGLSEEDKKILSNWIKGLFAVDEKGESSGIRDETMAGCSPQKFYLLVPTLFEQIVLGCRMKALVASTLKGGLEFLLEPFLLPSLVGGMGWLSSHVWEPQRDTDIVLQILQKLVKPTSISGDAHMMHQVILGIMYKDLKGCLQDIDRRTPNRKDVSALQAALKQYADSQYERDGTVGEVKEWTGPFSSLEQAVSNLVGQLTSWSSQSELNPIPPNYTHRMIDAAIFRCGPDETLDCLVNEVTSQTAVGFGAPGLEVATSLICAPPLCQPPSISLSVDQSQQQPGSSQMTLSEALKARLSDTKYLLRQEQAKAETLVRLGRLVDAHSVMLDIPFASVGGLDIPTADLMDVSLDPSDPAAAAAVATALDSAAAEDQAVNADFAAMDTAGLDLTGQDMGMGGDGVGGLNIDLPDDLFGGDGLGLGLDAGMVDTGTGAGGMGDDDIFAGIDLGIMGDDDFTF